MKQLPFSQQKNSLLEKIKAKYTFNKYFVILFIVLCLGAGTAYFIYINNRIFLENATLEVEGFTISSPYAAQVKAIHTNIGAQVKRDDLLLNFDTVPFERALATAENNLNLVLSGQLVADTYISAETEGLIKIQEERVSDARFNEVQARNEYEYWANLQAKYLLEMRKPNIENSLYQEKMNEEANAKLMKESAALKLANASSARAESEKSLQVLKDSQKSSILPLDSQAYAWRQRAKEARYALENAFILAPSHAIITEIYAKVGDTVDMNQALFKLSPQNAKNYTIIAYAPIEDASRIHKGQSATFYGQSISLEARVTDIRILTDQAQIILIPTELPESAIYDKGSLAILVQ